jgi:hypothetical protein
MTHDANSKAEADDLFARFDPWAALDDGRRQLVAALDTCDSRSGALALAIPQFAALGDSAGSVASMLLAHAARDRAHAVFFAALDAGDAVDGPIDVVAVDVADWLAVRAAVDAARLAMLEAAAGLTSEQWERTLAPPWDVEPGETVAELLIVRAIADGLLADAILALRDEPPEGEPAR